MDTRKRRKEGGCSQSLMFESLQSLPKRAKVHAQRKFAQGSQPTSPALTPIKDLRELRERTVPTECRTRLGLAAQAGSTPVLPPPAPPPLMNPPIRPKTEDFLTFLCFRRTSLLPPGLEFFETPQLMESSGGTESRGITPPQDEKPNKQNIQKKKEDIPCHFEKKGVPLSKDAIKRNLQEIESEPPANSIRSARVTRSSASQTPTPSFLSSPPSSNHTPQEGTPERRLSRKQMLLKKAMLFKSKSIKARRRRVQAHLRSKVENRRGVIPRGDKAKTFSPSTLNISTRNRARKAAKLFSLRKKEQISRVLKRLGTSVILSSIEKGCVTRSQIEASDEVTTTPATPGKPQTEETATAKESGRRKSSEGSETPVASPSKECRPIKEKTVVQEETKRVATKEVESKKSENEQEERSARKNPSPRRDLSLLKGLSAKQVLQKNRINAIGRRATRKLLSAKEKENAESESAPQESHARPRCTRSASDPVSSVTRSQAPPPPRVTRVPSERSKSCDDRAPLVGSGKSSKNKVSDSLDEKQTAQETEISCNLRTRPSRKTKQVAEVYLELMSQRLAKESQKGKELSDEDMEEDTISISSIKELKALTKSCKNKEVDLEKCMQEIAERHDKGTKEELSRSKDTKPASKLALGKRVSREKVPSSLPSPVKKRVDLPCPEGSRRHLRFSSTPAVDDTAAAAAPGAVDENAKEKASPTRTPPLRKHRSRSPKTSEPDATTEKNDSLSLRASRRLQRQTSPQQPKLTRHSAQNQKDSSNLQSSPSKDSLPPSSKPEKPALVKTSPEESSGKGLQKVLRKRAHSEASKTSKKDIVRRLSYDSTPKKESDADKELEAPAPVTKEENEPQKEDAGCKKNEIPEMVESENPKQSLQPTQNVKLSNSDSVAEDVKGLEKSSPVNESSPDPKKENCELLEVMASEDMKQDVQISQADSKDEQVCTEKFPTPAEAVSPVEKESESVKELTGSDSGVRPKKIVKPKCLSFCSRSKRTLSLDSDQNTSPKSIRLKRKFGSMESVISAGNKADAVTINRSLNAASVTATSSQSRVTSSKEIKQKTSDGASIGASQWKKSIFSRRRNSIHDEAKLNAVLESVAKDFEKDMDDQLFDKIEKDLNSGNKSPDKTNRTLLDSLEQQQLHGQQQEQTQQQQQLLEEGQQQHIEPQQQLQQIEQESRQENSESNVQPQEEEQQKPYQQSHELQATEKEPERESIACEEQNARASPLMQPSPSSGSPVPRKSTSGKKLCDVVRNLQERKQAESPLSYTDTEAPSFLQDLKALDSRNSEKQKQVSEEAIVMPPFDLAPAPSISSHSSDVPDRASHINIKQATHPCTSDQKAHGYTPDKITECSINKNELTSTSKITSSLEKEASVPVLLPSAVVPSAPKPSAILDSNAASINNANVAVTTFIPFPSINADPMLSLPIPNVNIAITTRPLTSLRPQTNIHVAPSQLPANIMPSRIAQLAHGVTIAPAPVPVPPVSTPAECFKSTKGDQPQPKATSKQVLIAPKPSWTQSSTNASSGQGMAPLKNLPKPIQIAPKFPANTSVQSASVGHLHSSAPILSASPMGHVIQGMPHPVQTVQPLPQGLQTVQAIPQGVQPLQAITQNFTTIAGMTSAVQAVITQTMAINQSQLVTPSSPKIITQPVFVTSSMPNMVGAPFDIAMQNHLHSNVGAVARVVTQNVVGKVTPKPQSLVTSGTQSLVTLPPGSIETNVIPSLVPLHQPLQPGQPTQFVAVNMMPVAPSPIPLSGARPMTSQMGSIICPQTMACIPSSNGAACSVPSVSAPLNLIPPGSIVTCPIPDMNAGICNASLIQPLQNISANTDATQSIKSNLSVSSVALAPVNSTPNSVNNTPSTTSGSNGGEEINNVIVDSTNTNQVVDETVNCTVVPRKLNFQGNCTDPPKKISDPVRENSNETPLPSDYEESDDKGEKDLLKDVCVEDTESRSFSTLTQSQSMSSSNAAALSLLKRNKNLKIETCSFERRNSAFQNFSSLVASPVVSEASKVFPVSTASEPLVNKEILGPVINVTAGNNIAELTKTSAQTVVDFPIKTITSHMILSNFVYTTTSVILPKMSDQSMTSPKAVTKVSQSSPPYVLSTSTSNDIPAKPMKSNSSFSFCDSKENLFDKQIGLSLQVKEQSSFRPILKVAEKQEDVNTTIVNSDAVHLVSKTAATTLASHSLPLSTTPSKKIDNTKLENNSLVLSPKTFYHSNQKRLIKDESSLREPNLANTLENKVISTPVSLSDARICSGNVPTTSLCSNKDLRDTSRDNSVVKHDKLNLIKNKSAGLPSKIDKKPLDKKSFPSFNDFSGAGKEASKAKELEKKNEKKREPILKKTLFKTKNAEDKKPSEAFSPLNESSVYAFEPEKETPLEVTSPFSQRIKNIHPSPSISPAKTAIPLVPKNPNSSFKDFPKDNKIVKNPKRSGALSKSDPKVLPVKSTKEVSSVISTVAVSTPVSLAHQSLTKPIVNPVSIGDPLKFAPTPVSSCLSKVNNHNASKVKRIIPSTFPVIPATVRSPASEVISAPKSSHQFPFNIKATTTESAPFSNSVPPCQSSEIKSAVKDLTRTEITAISSKPQVKDTIEKEITLPDMELRTVDKTKCLKEVKAKEKELKVTTKELRLIDKDLKTLEKEVRPLDREVRLIEKETRPLDKDIGPLDKEVRPLDIEVRPLDIEISPLDIEIIPQNKEVKDLDKEERSLDKEAKPLNKELRPLDKEVRPLVKEIMPLNKEIGRPSEKEVGIRTIEKEVKNVKEVRTIEKEARNLRNIAEVNLKDLESESNDSEELEIEAVNIGAAATKSASSTSIAIQCDLDDSQSEKSQDELRGNESGTQTEGPSKFPLPPSASPFYYLPLAMATLGEKLPAQLVQQMLAKTQGLVGAAEAGLILQQAAQLAQQYHRNTEEEGPPSSPPPSPAVKPISPKSGSIALQKALRANLASIAQAEISVAQSSGISLCPSSAPPSSPKELRNPPLIASPKGLLKVVPPLSDPVGDTSPPKVKEKPPEKSPKPSLPLLLSPEKETVVDKEEAEAEVEGTFTAESMSLTAATAPQPLQQRPKGKAKVSEVTVKRRSGRSSTLAATRATESDLQEVEELRRNRRAKRAAAALAKEEGWSSSSEAPMSPVMSPDALRGWPPPRLTSPTPSQSSEGTTASSSTVSQRSRVSAPHSRRQSPASGAESNRRGGRYSGGASSSSFSADPVIEPGPLHISDQPRLARAPSFFPSEEEFTDPIDYIEKIRPEAEQFGLCRIVPPNTFRPDCRVNDDMRFTAYKQYIHRMMRRWGPNDRVLRAIKKCLAKQNIELASNPVIGGLELDLVHLYKVVEKHGGLIKVIEKELWAKVADALRIPKSAQDRVTKLDSIYCKYLLPYAMLSKAEREHLMAEVDAAHTHMHSDEGSKKSASNESSDDDEEDEPLECIVKGKSTALSGFYRIARNIAGQWQPDPAGLEFDERYWDTVRDGDSYICVHTASIDTSEHGYGFPSQKNSPNAKHPWNLKNLCQNPNSVLRSMGNVIGVTAPTLHVGMMFSTVCWYRDPHSLPWIEYLHTGACKIWYGVSANNEENFRIALKKLVPDFIKDSPLWLPSDTAMVPPEDLVAEGVKVCRVVQEPGQFVVVFPGAFTSSVCSGYLISESAFFARPHYFDRAVSSFKTLVDYCEPSMFSLDRLALSVASDARATLDALVRARQVVFTIVEREKKDRQALVLLGLLASERLSTPDAYRKRKNRYVEDEEENCCEICRQHLYVSLVTNSQEEAVYCLQHAVIMLTSDNSQLPSCKLMYTYSLPELTSVLKQMDDRIHTKTSKRASAATNKRGKFSEQDSLSSTSGSNF